jgi:tight adherence protein C
VLDFVLDLLQPEVLITILIGIAAFATVLTLAAPQLERDTLKTRMAVVAAEREKMRAEQREKAKGVEARLRERKQKTLAQDLVNGLNLTQIFESEASRTLLRQAGLRGEQHLVNYLAARVMSPIMFALSSFAYVDMFYGDIALQLRIIIVACAALFGYFLPGIWVKNLIVRRQQSIKRAWSDALDLMLICVESGMGIEPALQRVCREIGSASVPLAEELTLTVAELSYLQDRRKAFENLAARTGLPTVKSVVTSLVQSERYGTPLGSALRVLAQENRDSRMAEAERKAAALPPMLTVPMIAFFLPVIFVIIMAPIAIKLFEWQ